MSVGLTSKSPIRAAALRPNAWGRSEQFGAIRFDRSGINRLAVVWPQDSGATADMVAIAPARQIETESRLLADGTLAQPWARIHDSVQQSLESLWGRVRQGRPGRLSRSGLVSTSKLPIFSHRVFYRRAYDEEEPIVVGVEVWLETDGYRILGEICGEDSGHSYFDEAAVASQADGELERAVEMVLKKLVGQVGVIVAALDDEE